MRVGHAAAHAARFQRPLGLHVRRRRLRPPHVLPEPPAHHGLRLGMLLMLEHIESIPWASFAQPATNAPSSIPNALRRLAAAEVESEARAAYQHFLFAIGNSHAG